ncbi:MAG: CCA tRNA nucleotidyltransferase, partial [Stellaceae bacterium]
AALDPAADDRAQRRSLYRLGAARYRDAALLLAAEGRIAPPRLARLLDLAARWTPPVFPVNGADAAALGIFPGPEVGRLLAEVRCWWEEGDFAADRIECLARLSEIV